eukprot:TRINITY_DN95502_c0_g1_i1.p2 TRINITY_DN95502_c0_g1~~TRINITY_DN95502_c0_g1_i1.p2  ORF type:complete len:189 (-),score=56.76 TRINITY_DN95502_c0_g1_i1:234-731(-)
MRAGGVSIKLIAEARRKLALLATHQDARSQTSTTVAEDVLSSEQERAASSSPGKASSPSGCRKTLALDTGDPDVQWAMSAVEEDALARKSAKSQWRERLADAADRGDADALAEDIKHAAEAGVEEDALQKARLMLVALEGALALDKAVKAGKPLLQEPNKRRRSA